ncbi:MAG: DinB family protein, partial [Gemmatimonadota bacterium]
MSMTYPRTGISDDEIPHVTFPFARHIVETYAGETNKVVSTWAQFGPDDLTYRPHPRATSVLDIIRHQLLSERRFFGEFLGTPEPGASDVVPTPEVESFIQRLVDLARARLGFLAAQPEPWWLEPVPFFDVERQRIWIFWRRVLHTAHHRSQLTVYLRLMDRSVPSTYGP